MEENFPDQESVYAAEGTLFHELCEIKVRRLLYPDRDPEVLKLAEEAVREHELYSAEMEEHATEFADWIKNRYEGYLIFDQACLLIDEKIKFDKYVPDGFGTCDYAVVTSSGTIEVLDLKYGKGVKVLAKNNAQLRLYALGIATKFNVAVAQFAEVLTTVYQPRLGHVETEKLHPVYLDGWGVSIRGVAEQAHAGQGERRTGDWCRWCRAKGACTHRAEDAMSNIGVGALNPGVMDDQELGSCLHIAENLIHWARDVRDEAENRAFSGKKIPGWKVVEGRSNRVIADKDKVYRILLDTIPEREKFIKPASLQGITHLEKHIGPKKLEGLIGQYVTKPAGKATLVPETDPRPALGSPEQTFRGVDLESASEPRN